MVAQPGPTVASRQVHVPNNFINFSNTGLIRTASVEIPSVPCSWGLCRHLCFPRQPGGLCSSDVLQAELSLLSSLTGLTVLLGSLAGLNSPPQPRSLLLADWVCVGGYPIPHWERHHTLPSKPGSSALAFFWGVICTGSWRKLWVTA